MKKTELKKLLNDLIAKIYETDADGYPTQAHRKIAGAQIVLEKAGIGKGCKI